MASDQQIFDWIRSSLGYRTTVGPTDKSKVQRAYEGLPSLRPSSYLGRAAWELARRLSPPPPPPPPTYKKVAPRVANKQDGADARFCCVNQPGVVRQDDGTYMDEVARYDTNGLSLGGRSPDLQVPGLVGAREMDGRDPCSLPTVGEPTKNTGSWAI